MKINIKPEDLLHFTKQVGQKTGLSTTDSFILADSLIFANLRGIDSHGIIRLPFYLKRLETKGTNINPKIRIIKQNSAVLLLDGDNGLGQVVGKYALDLSCQRARKTGIAYVSVRGSSHFGAASYYAYHIAEQDMIGIVLSNSTPVMSSWGGAQKVIGNNPLAFATPYKKGNPILLDIAMSGVAGGKVRLYAKNNKRIPKGWILNNKGKPSTDPNDFQDGGTLLPFGEHKGYGLAIAIEILTGVITGAGMLDQIPLWIKDMVHPLNIGQVFIAIDLGFFIDMAIYKKRLTWMVRQIKSSQLAKGFDHIYLPGEIEQSVQRRRKFGIPLSQEIWNDLKILSSKYRVDLPALNKC